MSQSPQEQPQDDRPPYPGRPSPGSPFAGQPIPPPPPPPPQPGQGPIYGPGQGYGYGQGQAAVSPSDARMWALLANLGGIFFSFIAPLIVYLIYKDRDPFIRRASAQALNFQIILIIGYAISTILVVVIIGLFTALALFICSIVFPIIASIAANRGENYDYPLIPQMVT